MSNFQQGCFGGRSEQYLRRERSLREYPSNICPRSPYDCDKFAHLSLHAPDPPRGYVDPAGRRLRLPYEVYRHPQLLYPPKPTYSIFQRCLY